VVQNRPDIWGRLPDLPPEGCIGIRRWPSVNIDESRVRISFSSTSTSTESGVRRIVQAKDARCLWHYPHVDVLVHVYGAPYCSLLLTSSCDPCL
jgi:hypothetical protein